MAYAIEIRNPALARRHLLMGLLLTRTAPVDADLARRALHWTLELAGSGEPLPPVGFIADVGNVALGLEADPARRSELPIPSGVDRGLVRRYDDYVLGKWYADPTFQRGADALLRYRGRQRVRGLAFLIERLRRRAGFGGVHLSPAVVKSLLVEPPEKVLAEAGATHEDGQFSPLLEDAYAELIAALRHLGEALGAEDIFELEHGTALTEFGQRVALRQVLRAASELERGLPKHKLRPPTRRRQVATQLLEEDAYPVGGFASIANRGSIESLLHSQLAYMERDERPDLFDVKLLRDELLYYARDENQLLRRRQTLLVALFPDLAQARFKDAALPWQRGILALASLVAGVRKLTEWLSHDALAFEFLVLDPQRLAAEAELLHTLFREPIASGDVIVAEANPTAIAARARERGRRSLCHCLLVSPTPQPVPAPAATVAQLLPTGPLPQLLLDGQAWPTPKVKTPLEAWRAALLQLLQTWIA